LCAFLVHGFILFRGVLFVLLYFVFFVVAFLLCLCFNVISQQERGRTYRKKNADPFIVIYKRKREIKNMMTNTTRTQAEKLIQADKIINDLKALAMGEGLPVDVAYKLMILGNLGRDLYALGFSYQVIQHARAWVKITNPDLTKYFVRLITPKGKSVKK
jgi:hypothetical protein